VCVCVCMYIRMYIYMYVGGGAYKKTAARRVMWRSWGGKIYYFILYIYIYIYIYMGMAGIAKKVREVYI
jgi:hypothetical protein